MITDDREASLREFVQKVADQQGITYERALRLLIDIANGIETQGGESNDAG